MIMDIEDSNWEWKFFGVLGGFSSYIMNNEHAQTLSRGTKCEDIYLINYKYVIAPTAWCLECVKTAMNVF